MKGIATLSEIARFGAVGLAATAVHFAVLRAGVEILGLPPVAMNGFAFLCAVSVTYVGQSVWVFRRPGLSRARLMRFAASTLGGLVGNVAIMALAVGPAGLPYEAGFLLALCLVPAATYLANKLWVFRADGAPR